MGFPVRIYSILSRSELVFSFICHSNTTLWKTVRFWSEVSLCSCLKKKLRPVALFLLLLFFFGGGGGGILFFNQCQKHFKAQDACQVTDLKIHLYFWNRMV